jgi:phosphatidylglycerol---prolipoprotein diacylglyceryl transferase
MLTYPAFLKPTIFTIDPFTVLGFTIGPVSVHWYGMMYLLSFMLGWWWAIKRSENKNSPVRKAQVEDLIVYGAIGVVVGGRLGYAVFYHLDRVVADVFWVFRVWEGGMSFHGGFIGAVVAMVVFARRYKIALLNVLDFIGPLIPIGLGLGRLGNFINQELWGRATSGWWGMVFPNDTQQLVRHPSQLYEAALEGVVLLVILYFFDKKPRPVGAVSGLGVMLYGVFRILVEFTREPDDHLKNELLLGWITRGQILSLPMVIGGAWLLIYAYQRPRSLLGRYS